jgi:hypothetical protein
MALLTALGLISSLPQCAASPARDMFTLDDIVGASVTGMDDVRYWADRTSPELERAHQARLDQERKALGAAALSRPASMLALSGGADDGAFGAGLLNGWSRRGDRPEFTVVTGVSTGALIAPLAFLGPSHDAMLKKAFTEINASDVFRLNVLGGLFGGDSLASTDPLRRLVASFADDALLEAVAQQHRRGRRLLVGTTNLDTQRPVMWDLGAIAASDSPNKLRLFHDVMVASAAVPGLFAPVIIETLADGRMIKELHVDGGVTMNVLGLPQNFELRERTARAGLKRKLAMYVIYNGRVEPDFSVITMGAIPITQKGTEWNSTWQPSGRTSRTCRRSRLTAGI